MQLPSLDTVAAIVLGVMLIAGCLGLIVRGIRTASPPRTPAWVWIACGITIGAAAWLRFIWVLPHHAMYIDEPWYLEAARNLLRRGALVLCQRAADDIVCTPYPKAAGWPVVLAAAFALFGAGSGVAFAVSGILSTAAALLAASVTRLTGGQWHHAIFAAALIAVHPLHVAWSATAETNAASTALLLAGIAGVLLVRRAPSLAGAAVAGGGLGLAAAIRPEMVMVLPPALAVLSRVPRRMLALVALGGALGATSVAASWSLYLSNSGGTFLAPSNLLPNAARMIATDQGGPVTLVIVFLALVGAVATWRRAAGHGAVLLCGGGLFVGLTAIGYDRRIFYPRTVLGALALLTPLAALALPRLRNARNLATIVAAGACGLALALAAPGLRRARLVSDLHKLETQLPMAIGGTSLPADAVIIAEWPAVLAGDTDLVAAAANDFAADSAALDALERSLERQPYFLVCDMFCEAGFAATAAPSACARILERFETEEITAVGDDRRRYGLYRLVRRATFGSKRTPCPFLNRESEPR